MHAGYVDTLPGNVVPGIPTGTLLPSLPVLGNLAGARDCLLYILFTARKREGEKYVC